MNVLWQLVLTPTSYSGGEWGSKGAACILTQHNNLITTRKMVEYQAINCYIISYVACAVISDGPCVVYVSGKNLWGYDIAKMNGLD